MCAPTSQGNGGFAAVAAAQVPAAAPCRARPGAVELPLELARQVLSPRAGQRGRDDQRPATGHAARPEVGWRQVARMRDMQRRMELCRARLVALLRPGVCGLSQGQLSL